MYFDSIRCLPWSRDGGGCESCPGSRRHRERRILVALDDAVPLAIETQRPDRVLAFVVRSIDDGYSHARIPKRAHRRRKISPNRRRAVFERDVYRCRHRGGWEHLSVEHIHPEALGSSSDLDDLQTLCRSGNRRKGTRV